MGDFKFACPDCGQHIVADESWGGSQMQCPACRCALIVPQQQTAAVPTAPLLPPSAPAAPAPPPSQPRISGARLQGQPSGGQAKAQTSAPPAPQPTRFKPPPV